MSLFRKIFGSSKDSRNEIQDDERGKYMPEIKLPIDERFTINFKANGGKFLYCEDIDEVNQNLNSIIQENDWKDKKVLLFDERFIIFATTSQFVETISEGLRGIKVKNRNKIPTNITTIKHFKACDDKDFLSYGSSSKNLYLLLLEDL